MDALSNCITCKLSDMFVLQRSCKDTSNFDSIFTKETMKMTPTDTQLLTNVNKTMFGGFTYVNPKFLSKE